MSNRLKSFLSCKHLNIQQFTEICLDCGENIYTTAVEIKDEEDKEKNKKDETWNENGW